MLQTNMSKKEHGMNTHTSRIKRHALLIFCTLTIALTSAATRLPLPGEVVSVVMVFIPTLIALSLTAMADGWGGVRALLGKLAQWRMRPTWIVIALALGLVLRVTMSGIALLLGLIPAIHLRPWSPMQLALFAVMLFLFAIPEELGWRGYALPKLLKTHSPLVAGLIIGMLWGSLHLALTLPGMIYAGAPQLPILLEVTGLSVLATWFYVRTNGNLLVTSVFHAAQSFFVIVTDGVSPEQQLWLMAVVLLTTTLVVAIAEWPSFAQKPPLDGEARARRATGQPRDALPGVTAPTTRIPEPHER